MSKSLLGEWGMLHVSALERINEICLEFETAWKQGKRPRMEDRFGGTEAAERFVLFKELLFIELEYRRRCGESPAAAEYHGRFPEDASLIETVFGSAGEEVCPRIIDKYSVVARLGGGGQADVYRVVHPTLEKELILKISRRPVGGQPSRLERILNEGKVLAEIEHPHLARVCDSGVFEGRPFIVMEYLRGRNLAQHFQDRRPSPREAAILAAKVARALDAAHRRGILHQDMKPENIVMDVSGQPHLIDFGLASLHDAWRGSPRVGGAIAGTARFMAPEQARGEAEGMGPRSDIFGLGAVLYWLLAGQAPFSGDGTEECLDRARRCEFDAAALGRPEIPRRLARICLKALAADPRGRFSSAAELARALESFAGRGARRAAAAAVVLALALLGTGLLLMQGCPGTAKGPGVSEEFGLKEVRFARGKNFLPPGEAPPVRTGDSLMLSWKIPSGLKASLFWIDPEGKLYSQEVGVVEEDGAGTIIRYPQALDKFVSVAGEPGTEVLVLCARRATPLGREELQEAVGPDGAWPQLPGSAVVYFDRNRVWVSERSLLDATGAGAGSGTRGPGGLTEAPDKVVARAEALRRELARRCEFVYGMAIPHVRAGS